MSSINVQSESENSVSDVASVKTVPPVRALQASVDGLGARLRTMFELRKMTQRRVSELVGISPGFLNDVVNERKRPSVELLVALRHVLDVSCDWLLTGEGSPSLDWRVPQPINTDTLNSIRLLVAIARAAVVGRDPTAERFVDSFINERRAPALVGDYRELADGVFIPLGDEDALAFHIYSGHVHVPDASERALSAMNEAVRYFAHMTRKPAFELDLGR